MIISNGKRFIFVHIPKTGGTSITQAIAPSLRWNDVICGGTAYGEKIGPPYEAQFGLWKHSLAGQIKAVVGDEVWADYFTFGFVREPYGRMRSLYTYTEGLVRSYGLQRHLWRLRSDKAPWNWAFIRAYLGSNGFSEFIRHPLLESTSVARPMSDYLTEDGRIIVDFVGKMENMTSDFGQVAARIGAHDLELGQANRSRTGSGGPERFYRDQADYDWVYERYLADFTNFGYPRVESA
jgi:hypothetical protein